MVENKKHGGNILPPYIMHKKRRSSITMATHFFVAVDTCLLCFRASQSFSQLLFEVASIIIVDLRTTAVPQSTCEWQRFASKKSEIKIC